VIYGLYHSAAGMMVNEHRQDVIANNLANADTPGFKRDIASFAERQPAALAGLRDGPSNEDLAALSGGLWLGRTETDFCPGPLKPGGELDVALDGPGFLKVASNGKTLVTRDGRMVLDDTGRLLSAGDGAEILGRGDMPIQVNPRGGQPQFDEDGRILQDGIIVGQLALVDFADYRELRKVGDGRFSADGLTEMDSPAYVRAGFVESSSVEAVKELVSMIEASRAYQLNAQMVTLQDQTVGALVSMVSR
jgi:flagellar basal-body rod protein FlgF